MELDYVLTVLSSTLTSIGRPILKFQFNWNGSNSILTKYSQTSNTVISRYLRFFICGFAYLRSRKNKQIMKFRRQNLVWQQHSAHNTSLSPVPAALRFPLPHRGNKCTDFIYVYMSLLAYLLSFVDALFEKSFFDNVFSFQRGLWKETGKC